MISQKCGFLFDENGAAYLDGKKVGRAVMCVELAGGILVRLPKQKVFRVCLNKKYAKS